jgi:hypothetical protein
LPPLRGRKLRHHKGDIVTSNPVIGGDGGIWFGDGPYQSLDHARLACSTSPAARKKSLSGSDDLGEARLVQDVTAAFRKTVPRRSRIKLRNLGFQVFVDQQQCLQCTAQIAVAACYNLVDDGFTWSGSHRNSSSFPAWLTARCPIRIPYGCDMNRPGGNSLSRSRPSVRKSPDHGYKMANDARMTRDAKFNKNHVAFLPLNIP